MKSFFKKLFGCSKHKQPEPINMMEDEPVNLAVLENPKYRYNTFTMSPLESWRYEKFMEEHKAVCGDDTTYSLKFDRSSGIGTGIIVRCDKCGQLCDITDVGTW